MLITVKFSNETFGLMSTLRFFHSFSSVAKEELLLPGVARLPVADLSLRLQDMDDPGCIPVVTQASLAMPENEWSADATCRRQLHTRRFANRKRLTVNRVAA